MVSNSWEWIGSVIIIAIIILMYLAALAIMIVLPRILPERTSHRMAHSSLCKKENK